MERPVVRYLLGLLRGRGNKFPGVYVVAESSTQTEMESRNDVGDKLLESIRDQGTATAVIVLTHIGHYKITNRSGGYTI